jgi:RNA polymerase sigma-70 factor (ECF subfamily)
LDQESRLLDSVEFEDQALAALIGKVSEGDIHAFADIYDLTNRLLFGIVRRMHPEKTVSEEILLDVYTQVWKQSADYDPREFLPLEWLVNIARNRSIRALDASKETRKRSVTEADQTVVEATLAPSLQNLARSCLDSLPPSQREALEWAFYTGLSCSEIAIRSGKPQGAVRTYTRIGMSKLYDLFRPLYTRIPPSAEGSQGIEPRKTD